MGIPAGSVHSMTTTGPMCFCRPCAVGDHSAHIGSRRCRCFCIAVTEEIRVRLALSLGFSVDDGDATALAAEIADNVMGRLVEPAQRSAVARALAAADYDVEDMARDDLIAVFEAEGWDVQRGPQVQGHPHAVLASRSTPRSRERLERVHVIIPTDRFFADSDDLVRRALNQLAEVARTEEIIGRRYSAEDTAALDSRRLAELLGSLGAKLFGELFDRPDDPDAATRVVKVLAPFYGHLTTFGVHQAVSMFAETYGEALRRLSPEDEPAHSGMLLALNAALEDSEVYRRLEDAGENPGPLRQLVLAVGLARAG